MKGDAKGGGYRSECLRIPSPRARVHGDRRGGETKSKKLFESVPRAKKHNNLIASERVPTNAPDNSSGSSAPRGAKPSMRGQGLRRCGHDGGVGLRTPH